MKRLPSVVMTKTPHLQRKVNCISSSLKEVPCDTKVFTRGQFDVGNQLLDVVMALSTQVENRASLPISKVTNREKMMPRESLDNKALGTESTVYLVVVASHLAS